MAEVTWDIDTDSGTGYDYASLNAWEAAEQTDLVADGDIANPICRASSGSADTTVCEINGWTTGAANYILIEEASGDEALKDEWDATRYRLSVTDPDQACLLLKEDYVRIDGIQTELIYSTANYKSCIGAGDISETNNDLRVMNCRVRTSATGETTGVNLNVSNVNASIWNTIATGFYYGIRFGGATGKCYHNVAYDSGAYGIVDQGDTSTVIRNCASFANDDDWYFGGTVDADYNASDDGDGTHSVSPSGSDWDNEFVDPANGDFTPLNTGNIYHAGIAISGLTTDMLGKTWDDPPTIGVVEYVASGGLFIPVAMNHYRSMK